MPSLITSKHGLAGLLVGLWLANSWLGQAQAEDLKCGAEVFAANCASCHGAAGYPDPDSPLVQSLGVMPANFSDALFNSREPASDWKIVITHGGPALGFSDRMPAFGDSLTQPIGGGVRAVAGATNDRERHVRYHKAGGNDPVLFI